MPELVIMKLTFQGGSNISAIEQSADENGATMALVVAHNEETKMVSGASIVLGTGNNPSYISISADAINLEGVITANGRFQINTDGSMIATGGTIGGLKIQNGGITYGEKTLSRCHEIRMMNESYKN